ncbi:MAG: 3-deoxy-manno-octulosonate cytidylyltransferase [Proteobacteria bacterium]|nr:3-deoxy-manno-octulosonate cytidylyltransferase [Pseudomonadota bacterium]
MDQSDLLNWLVVIPARLTSERLPRKPLQILCGKTLLEQVYQNLLPLKEGCLKAKIPFIMTNASHQSGTDRCREASRGSSRSFVLNVQGDEPFVALSDLKSLMRLMESSDAPMGTLAFKSSSRQDFASPHIVKIARSGRGSAIYFSRAPIPHDRNALAAGTGNIEFWQHLGVYAFTKLGLNMFCDLPSSTLEQIEKLEQLRAVEAGWSILVCEAKQAGFGIDTPEDLQRAQQLISSQATAK